MGCDWCGGSIVGRKLGARFCSDNCKNTVAVKAWRRRTKLKAIAYRGGKCARCGYKKNAAALIFHHPGSKAFSISARHNWGYIREELDKCILLCLNCHAEAHHDELEVADEHQ